MGWSAAALEESKWPTHFRDTSRAQDNVLWSHIPQSLAPCKPCAWRSRRGGPVQLPAFRRLKSGICLAAKDGMARTGACDSTELHTGASKSERREKAADP